jgi:hypothetical protein
VPLLVSGQPVSSNRLLRQLLNQPGLVTTVQALSPKSLLGLIDNVGLEDAGEILALATSEQLLEVFDLDVWRRRQGGEDDVFDETRFLLWLEILLEGGEKKVVSRLSDLPEELLYLAFHTHIIVLNLDNLFAEMSSCRADRELDEKALESCLGHELDEYHIIARQHDGWDALLTTVLALYDREPDLLNRILSRCCHADFERIEENGGLYNVLSATEMLESDAAADRSDRRARQGFVAPSDAKAFLGSAASANERAIIEGATPDPIARAYFREWEKPEQRKPDMATQGASPMAGEREAAADSRLLAILEDAGVVEASTLSIAESTETGREQSRFQAALLTLAESTPEDYEQRMLEVVFLANVLDAGLGSSENPIRTADALKAVFDVLEVGLAFLENHRPDNEDPVLRDKPRRSISPIDLFKLGWRSVSETHEIGTFDELQRAIKRTWTKRRKPETNHFCEAKRNTQ